MASLPQMERVHELGTQGWDIIQFPRTKDSMRLGGPVYMCSPDKEIICIYASAKVHRMVVENENSQQV